MEKEYFEKAVAFIRSIGIEVVYCTLEQPTFLPGINIHKGRIEIDRQQLKYPGDILHEAGHIASVPLPERDTLTAESIGQREHHEAEEMMAIAWSYAACVHLSISPYFVFHDEGYNGGGTSIAGNFMQGNYFGVPMLQWAGLTAEPCMAARLNRPSYPQMIKWVRE